MRFLKQSLAKRETTFDDIRELERKVDFLIGLVFILGVANLVILCL
jgi:hypothetical protein